MTGTTYSPQKVSFTITRWVHGLSGGHGWWLCEYGMGTPQARPFCRKCSRTCMWKHLREHDPTMKWIPMAQKWWFCSAIINQFKKTNKNGCVSSKFLQGATWVRKLQRFWWHPTYHAHATRMHPPCQCGGCTFETIDPQHPVHDLHISQDAARFQLSKNAVVPCQGILGEGG